MAGSFRCFLERYNELTILPEYFAMARIYAFHFRSGVNIREKFLHLYCCNHRHSLKSVLTLGSFECIFYINHLHQPSRLVGLLTFGGNTEQKKFFGIFRLNPLHIRVTSSQIALYGHYNGITLLVYLGLNYILLFRIHRLKYQNVFRQYLDYNTFCYQVIIL